MHHPTHAHRHSDHAHETHTHRMRPQAYQPLMDWWVAGLVLLTIAIFSASIPIFIASTLPVAEIVILVIVAMAIILYISDIAFFSYYILGPHGLSVVSQLRHAFFPYRDMVEIKPGNIIGLFSFARRKRFSLSANCFFIRLRHSQWRVITVSPVEKDAFINVLLEQIDHERSSRATIERVHP